MRWIGIFFIVIVSVSFTVVSCDRVGGADDLTWTKADSDYEGYPLRVEKPVYANIYEYKERYPRLVRVTLKFDSVMTNGWPKPEYEAALADFDKDMRGLFDKDTEGIIFLIETFGAKRSYHYFVSDVADYMSKFAEIQNRYPTTGLDPSTKMNSNWEFLDEYPVKLY